ncbi:MAG: NUDIX hydrolase [Chitinophagaceae bacterium]|nr:NUDIX hydrolase [Chitinophagaceae bacterium]
MKKMKWNVLESKDIFSENWLKLRKDKCMLPDGRIMDPYYVIEVPSWTNMVIITKDEKIVLVKQYRHASGEITLELPGGLLEKGETPKISAIREMQEETGYVSNEIEFLSQVLSNPALHNNTAYFFLARNAEKMVATHFDPFEDLQLETYTKEELKQLLNEGKIQHGVQVGAIYQAMLRLNWMSW